MTNTIPRFVMYSYDDLTYTLDTANNQMTVYEEGEEFAVSDPLLVADVMTNGTRAL